MLTFCKESGLHTLCWPVQSPGFNLIQNMWAEVKRHLQKWKTQPSSRVASPLASSVLSSSCLISRFVLSLVVLLSILLCPQWFCPFIPVFVSCSWFRRFVVVSVVSSSVAVLCRWFGHLHVSWVPLLLLVIFLPILWFRCQLVVLLFILPLQHCVMVAWSRCPLWCRVGSSIISSHVT